MKNDLITYLGVLGMMFGLGAFLSNRKHLLSMLLSLEYVGLSLFMVFLSMLVDYNGEMYLLLFYLIIIVCEGVLGLGVVVGSVRLGGNDYFSSFSLLKC